MNRTTTLPTPNFLDNAMDTITAALAGFAWAGLNRTAILEAANLYQSGMRHHSRGNYAEAVQAFTRCFKLLDKRAGSKVLYALGRSQFELARQKQDEMSLVGMRIMIEEAVFCFQQAARLSKDHIATRVAAKDARLFLAEREQAFADAERKVSEMDGKIAEVMLNGHGAEASIARHDIDEARFSLRHFGLGPARASMSRAAAQIRHFA